MAWGGWSSCLCIFTLSVQSLFLGSGGSAELANSFGLYRTRYVYRQTGTDMAASRRTPNIPQNQNQASSASVRHRSRWGLGDLGVGWLQYETHGHYRCAQWGSTFVVCLYMFVHRIDKPNRCAPICNLWGWDEFFCFVLFYVRFFIALKLLGHSDWNAHTSTFTCMHFVPEHICPKLCTRQKECGISNKLDSTRADIRMWIWTLSLTQSHKRKLEREKLVPRALEKLELYGIYRFEMYRIRGCGYELCVHSIGLTKAKVRFGRNCTSCNTQPSLLGWGWWN